MDRTTQINPQLEEDSSLRSKLERLAKANETASLERLRSLTLESAIHEFEELCREVHDAFPDVSCPRSHPVGLIKLMRQA
jgi:hypothetical protein